MSRSEHVRFSDEILPHLDAAFAQARSLVRNDQDAQDIVQESLVKALRYMEGYKGLNGRAWLMAIVRNTAFAWLGRHRPEELMLNGEGHSEIEAPDLISPESAMIRGERHQIVRNAFDRLPVHLREVLLLREVEGMAYKTIAEIVGSPIGTVMSRLSRAREQLGVLLTAALRDGSS